MALKLERWLLDSAIDLSKSVAGQTAWSDVGESRNNLMDVHVRKDSNPKGFH